MSVANTVNKTLFTLTYNEQADKAYNDQLKAAEKSVQAIKNKIEEFRKQREIMIRNNTASDYYAFNSDQYLTEWSNWIQKNANLSEGDYAAKQTEIKTKWEALTNINQMAIEMGRIPTFLDFYIKDKMDNLTSEQKKNIEKLRDTAKTYFEKMNKQSPADIISKRDEFNTQFSIILKSIDEKFKSPNDPKSLLQAINNEFYNNFVEKVKQREKANESQFSVKRGLNTAKEYTFFFVSWSLQLFFAFVFAIIITNDNIGRPSVYRTYFFIFTLILFFIYPYSYVIGILYYIFRLMSGTAPVLFSMLPIHPKEYEEGVKPNFFSFNFDVHKKEDYAIKKELEYFTSLAEAVKQPMSLSILKDMAKTNAAQDA